MAEPNEVKRLLATKLLVAGLNVDLGVLRDRCEPFVRVVVAMVYVNVDAAEPVDRALEAAEIDLDDVVDLDPEQVANRLQRQLRAAKRERCVDLVAAVAGDVNLQVARNRHHCGRFFIWIEPDEHQRV
ncbi:unannotated protein [freshwater metagenome]|uniref:Unannotated protein n=1 Tax=freshwater metagenome TaxID=449393 RepID=A0A6J6A2C8_9ZZZZ